MSGKKRCIRILRYWLPLFLYMGLIFCLSHSSDPLGGRTLPVSDKVVHFVEFFGLFVLTIRAFHHSDRAFFKQGAWWKSIVFCLCYAVSDEWHQQYIPERDSSLYDIAANMAGILCAAGIALVQRWRTNDPHHKV